MDDSRNNPYPDVSRYKFDVSQYPQLKMGRKNVDDKMRDWLVSQSGNPSKAWIVSGGKKISPLMSLTSARQLAKLHNTELHYEVLAAYKEQACLASRPEVTGHEHKGTHLGDNDWVCETCGELYSLNHILPSKPQVTEGELAEIMQRQWNDYTMDTGCYPSDFIQREGKLIYVDFTGDFGERLARAVMQLLKEKGIL